MIDWDKVKYFSPEEFSENPDKYANSNLIYKLDDFRKLLGNPIYPSPVSGALARYKIGSTKSMHYVNDAQKSRAIDIFPEGIPIEIFTMLIHCNLFNGIGIYLHGVGVDGSPWVRFHVDIREKGFKESPLIWIVDKDLITKKEIYYYPQLKNTFWGLLKDDRLYKKRIKHNYKRTSKINTSDN